MSRREKEQSIVAETVEEVLESAVPRLREEMVGRILQELRVLEQSHADSPAELLSTASAAIQESSSQADILRRFLEGSARFAGRAALFVIKGGAGSGWQAMGFENNDQIRNLTVSAGSGLLGAVFQRREPISGPCGDLDPGFAGTMGMPVNGVCTLLPLVVREKVAAVLYADAGTASGPAVDGAALAILARFTSIWLELTALRKASGGAVAEEPVAAPTPAPAAEAPPSRPAEPESPEEEFQRKAKRFAKLLVDEIKLYNPAKVAEGRQSRDIYGALREDIEKSRATYDKRYGESPDTAAYFSQELIRILADNDVTLMGDSFPG